MIFMHFTAFSGKKTVCEFKVLLYFILFRWNAMRAVGRKRLSYKRKRWLKKKRMMRCLMFRCLEFSFLVCNTILCKRKIAHNPPIWKKWDLSSFLIPFPHTKHKEEKWCFPSSLEHLSWQDFGFRYVVFFNGFFLWTDIGERGILEKETGKEEILTLLVGVVYMWNTFYYISSIPIFMYFHPEREKRKIKIFN